MTTQEQYINVCHNIRFLRQRAGLSQTAMAKKLHITRKNLQMLETGTFPQRISISFFFYVHQAFGIPPQELLLTRLHGNEQQSPDAAKCYKLA